MRAIQTDKAPKPIGPYSQGVVAGNFVFLSGQIGLDPKTGMLREGFQAQAEQVFENIDAILHSIGADRRNIVRVVVYMRDLSLFKDFNRIYEDYFKDVQVKPARSTVEVSNLPMDAFLEVEVTAWTG